MYRIDMVEKIQLKYIFTVIVALGFNTIDLGNL